MRISSSRNYVARNQHSALAAWDFELRFMLNTASLSTLPQSTNELYAQMLYVALQRLGLDAHAYLDDPERAASSGPGTN